MDNPQNQANGEAHGPVKTILVVEDDEAIGSFVVEALLQETPYQALLATNGQQALQIVQSLKPNIFLLDYRLPDMNGLEIYDQLHATKGLEDIPTVLMSATIPQKEVQKRQLIALHKPFELSELIQIIEALLA